MKCYDGEAVVYCEGAFSKTDGKTAHGLVRFTRRYDVKAVIDSTLRGKDAGEYLDGEKNGIPIVGSLDEAGKFFTDGSCRYFVVGLAVVGGRLTAQHRVAVEEAIKKGFNVDCGLHEFLTENRKFSRLAKEHGVVLRDVRKTPSRGELHAFTGEIETVDSFRVAVLGTDSAIGKRTTAWKIVEGFEKLSISSELIGTGQTAWMQGARYGVLMDSLINDFVAGEMENSVLNAWRGSRPEVMVIEGQGGLLNPGFPGGFEILAATRPDVIVLQHAPARECYDDFPGYKIQPLAYQIHALEIISGKKVVAITLNHSGLDAKDIDVVCDAVSRECGLPCFDALIHGPEGLVKVLMSSYREKKEMLSSAESIAA